MRRNTMKYGIGLAMALLATACSNEIIEPDGGTDLPDMQEGLGKIVITLPAEEAATRAEDLHGEVTVDKGRVLIFSTTEDKESDFTFEKGIDVSFASVTFDGSVTFKEDDCETDGKTRMTAYANFTPESGKLYKIYAYAYNSAGVTITEDVEGKRLQNGDTDLDENSLASISATRLSSPSATMEIYGGWIYEYTLQPYPTSGGVSTGPVLNQQQTTEIKNYGGSLKRQTGRLEITLTNVPTTVESATLIVEKHQDKIPIGMEALTNMTETDYYPNPFDAAREDVITVTPQSGNLHFVADMFPVEASKMYIQIKDSEGENEYQIRVKDMLENTIFIGVSVYVSRFNLITIFSNFWIGLNTEYENLLQEGNWIIDFDWGADYNSGVQLIPSTSN